MAYRVLRKDSGPCETAAATGGAAAVEGPVVGGAAAVTRFVAAAVW